MKNFFAAAAAALAIFAACGAEASLLRVGTDADFQPYEYYQAESGTYTGFDVELIEALARLMGCDGAEFVTAPFDELLQGLDENRYDAAIAAFIVTAERRHEADFTAPYAEDRTVSVMTDESAATVGGRVNTAAEKGTVHMIFARQNYAGQGEIIEAESVAEAVGMLFEGEAGRAVTSKLSAEYLIANVYGERLVIASEDGAAQPLAIAVRKGNSELLDKLDEALARYKNSAAYEQLYRTYFGTCE